VERKPKTSPSHSTSGTPHPHAAPQSTGGQTTASGATAGASAPKGAGGIAGAGNTKPAYLSNPHPPYPTESKASHEQGLVMLAVSINESGDVTSVSVSQSSGFPRLDQAAREGVSHWRFRPARVAGFAVASHLAVPVRFRLSD
jgi:protein TonB